ncbi:MAG: hypothetical protein MK538_18145, partial [Planctomycetes bacterium]|nr:hypothetical protein [Planctomycetota bacterium]
FRTVQSQVRRASLKSVRRCEDGCSVESRRYAIARFGRSLLARYRVKLSMTSRNQWERKEFAIHG